MLPDITLNDDVESFISHAQFSYRSKAFLINHSECDSHSSKFIINVICLSI